MNAGKVSVRNEVTRRTVLGAGVASAVLATAGLALAQQSAPAQQAPLLKGPPVWLDMDQAELDAAYDQSKYAPNLAQITARYATNSEALRARLGAPRRFAYGDTPIEGLDVYMTKRPNAAINIFIHGGAWRGGLAKDFGYAAELFVHAGAHYVVPDFTNVIEAGGSLMPMAEQVRRAVAWVYRNARSFGGDPERIYVSGHSSGGHLAGVVLTTDWRKDFDLPADTVKGGCQQTPCRRSFLFPAAQNHLRDHALFEGRTHSVRPRAALVPPGCGGHAVHRPRLAARPCAARRRFSDRPRAV